MTRKHIASLCPLYFPTRSCCSCSESVLVEEQRYAINTENITLLDNTQAEEVKVEICSTAATATQATEPLTHLLLDNMDVQEATIKADTRAIGTNNVNSNEVCKTMTVESTCESSKWQTDVHKANTKSLDVKETSFINPETLCCEDEVKNDIMEKCAVNKNDEESLALSSALFGLTDMKTGAVTHISAAERIAKEMPLLEDWVKEELFVESNWVDMCAQYDKQRVKIDSDCKDGVGVNNNRESTFDVNADKHSVSINSKIMNADNSNVIDEKADNCGNDSVVGNATKTVAYTQSTHNLLVNDTKLFVNVIGRPKLLRILLIRYLTHPLLWRDSADEVLQLAVQTIVGNFENDRKDKLYNKFESINKEGDELKGNKEDKEEKYTLVNDEKVSRLIDSVKAEIANYLHQPVNEFNFYTPALFDKLVKFLEIDETEFCNTRALWDAFVIYNRTDTSTLLSPQRPPFSFGELHPTIAAEDLYVIESHCNNNTYTESNTTLQTMETESLPTTTTITSPANIAEITCPSCGKCSISAIADNMDEIGRSKIDENSDVQDKTTIESPISSNFDNLHNESTTKGNTNNNYNNSNTNNSIKCESKTTSSVEAKAPLTNNNLAHTLLAESWEELDEYKQNEILFGKAAAELSLRLRPKNGMYVVHYSNSYSSSEYGSSEYAADATYDSVATETTSEMPTIDKCTDNINDAEHAIHIVSNDMSAEQPPLEECSPSSKQGQRKLAMSSAFETTVLTGHESAIQDSVNVRTSSVESIPHATCETTSNANKLYELNKQTNNIGSESNHTNCQEASFQENVESRANHHTNDLDEYEKLNVNEVSNNSEGDAVSAVESTEIDNPLRSVTDYASTSKQLTNENDWDSANHFYDIDRLLCSIIERYFDTERSATNICNSVTLHANPVKLADKQKGEDSTTANTDRADNNKSTKTLITTTTTTLQKEVNLKYRAEENHKVIGWGSSENTTNGKTNKTNTGTSKKRKQRALRELYYTNAHISSSGEQGEIEDLHLSKLWDAFTKTETSELISIYYDVHHRFDSIKREVCTELLAQSILLLLFFARDEVRAITAPDKTYYQLWHLHAEICRLVALLEHTCGDDDDDAFTCERGNKSKEQEMSEEEYYLSLQQVHQGREHSHYTKEKEEHKGVKCEQTVRWCVPHFESLPYDVQLSYTCFGISHLFGKHTELSNYGNKSNVVFNDNFLTLHQDEQENEQKSAEQERLSRERLSQQLSYECESKSTSPFDLFCSWLKVYKFQSNVTEEESQENCVSVCNTTVNCNALDKMDNNELREWFDSLTFVQRKAIDFCFPDADTTYTQQWMKKCGKQLHSTSSSNNYLKDEALTLANSIITKSPMLLYNELLDMNKECQTKNNWCAVSEKIEWERQDKLERSPNDNKREENMELIINSDASKNVKINSELLHYMQLLEKKVTHSVIALVEDVLCNVLQSSGSKNSTENEERKEERNVTNSGVCLSEHDVENDSNMRDLIACMSELTRSSSEKQSVTTYQKIDNGSSDKLDNKNNYLLDVISAGCTRYIFPLIKSTVQELSSKLLEQHLLQNNMQLEENQTENCINHKEESSVANNVKAKRKYTKRLHCDKEDDTSRLRRTKRRAKEIEELLHQEEHKLAREDESEKLELLPEEKKTKRRYKYQRKERKKVGEEECPSSQEHEEEEYEENEKEKLERKVSARYKVKRQSKRVTERQKSECSVKNIQNEYEAETISELQQIEIQTKATSAEPATKTAHVVNRREYMKAKIKDVNTVVKANTRKERKTIVDNNKNNSDVDQQSLVVVKPKRQYRRRKENIAKTINGKETLNDLRTALVSEESGSERPRDGKSNGHSDCHNSDTQTLDDCQEISL